MGKDIKHLYFELLEYLSDYGIGVEANIKEVCTKYAEKPIDEVNVNGVFDFEKFSERWSKVTSVLGLLEKMVYIKYSTKHGHLEQLLIQDGNLSASITKDGLDYYYTHVLRKATARSFKNQIWYNLVTWAIAIISIAFSIFLAFKNNGLSNRLTQLEKERQQLKSSQHLKVASDKNPNIR